MEPPAPLSDRSNGNNRILIIDDDPGVLESYLSILGPPSMPDITLEGELLFGDSVPVAANRNYRWYELVSCDRGEEGIEAVQGALASERPFAVAFIDISMPGIDGSETARRILMIDPRIKIVVVTACSGYRPDDIIGATHREELFFLRKPFHPEEIGQFARALTKQWDLEQEKDSLSVQLEIAYQEVREFNKSLQDKVAEQTSLLIQSEKMASVGLLAAGVAHEINNPISFVDSNLSTLKKYAVRIAYLLEQYNALEESIIHDDAVRTSVLLDTIRAVKESQKIDYILEDMVGLTEESLDGARRVKEIVKDLKIFSRAGSDELNYVDLNETIDAAINIVWNELKNKAQIIKSYGDLPKVRCNPQKIGQVFLNILVNAAQAIETEGIVRLASRYLRNGLKSESGWVEVIISDNGCGIADGNLSRIFDPFFTTKPVGQGTGLGLSIAYDIVRAHGGSIRAHSHKEEGTVFTVTLPLEGPMPVESASGKVIR